LDTFDSALLSFYFRVKWWAVTIVGNFWEMGTSQKMGENKLLQPARLVIPNWYELRSESEN
jgi:hypothetical protein